MPQIIWVTTATGEPIPLKLDGNGKLPVPAGTGGAATIADGASVTQGALADAAVTNPALSASEIALLKGLLTLLGRLPVQGQAAMAASLPVVLASNQTAIPTAALTLTYTDRSGTITTGGTPQTMMIANTNRKALYIRNPSDATEDLWICFTGAAAVSGAGSVPIAPGSEWKEQGGGVTTQAVSVFGATTAHAWIALEGA